MHKLSRMRKPENREALMANHQRRHTEYLVLCTEGQAVVMWSMCVMMCVVSSVLLLSVNLSSF